MSSDDPNFIRLKTIIFLFTILVGISAAQAVFLNVDTSLNEAISVSGLSVDNNEYDLTLQDTGNSGFDFLGFLLSFFGFFFGGFLLSITSLPLWMYIIVIFPYIILLIVFWYLIIDFIKDITIVGSSL